ncbi:UNVERIFIED_CONTAM: hypothetical protein Sradi_3843000 [Sesamum radiatum]|uniref:Uncharacterized protein n=1 Tax=Sesamum radiatum TaxID=300843 RepID=A0AAW2Q1I0_SESRA
MKGKCFAHNLLEEEQSAFPIKEDVTQIWHKRVGHYHHQGLLQLREKELALDVPKLSDEISSYKACQFGNQSRKPFPKSTWRATHKLQLIHMDVAGPQRTPSLKASVTSLIRELNQDVHFVEDEEWNWDDAEKKGQTMTELKLKFYRSSNEEDNDWQSEIVDHAHVRGKRLDTIRLLLAIVAQKSWKVFQLDIKSAFLNGVLQEEIYVEQLQGFVKEGEGEGDKVYLLKKALYGLV